MSSLSQEDLDAGWGEIDAAVSRVPLESMIAPAKKADETAENQGENGASAAPLTAEIVAPVAAKATQSEPAILPDPEPAPPRSVVTPIATVRSECQQSVPPSEPFTPVEQKSQLLALTVVDVPIDCPADARSRDEVSAGTADSQRLVDVPAAVSSVPTAALKEGVAKSAAPPVPAAGRRKQRQWSVGVAAGVALAVIVSVLVSVSAGRKRVRQAQLQPQSVLSQTVSGASPKNAPMANAPLAPSLADSSSAAGTVAAPQASATGNVNSSSESFTDAFVKHAAKVDSNWADVKKRARTLESSQTTKGAGLPTKSSDDPLDVLDKLEKARKSKQSTTNK